MVRGGDAQGGSSRADIFLLLLLGRIFFGKNKVMMVALGREPSSEYKENLHKVPAELPLGVPKLHLVHSISWRNILESHPRVTGLWEC